MNWAHLAEASWISHASGCRRSRLEVWPTEERPGFNQQHEICSQNKVMNHSHAVGHSLVGGLEHEIYIFSER